MADRETPGSPTTTWVERFRLFLGRLTKNRRGAKVGHAGPGEPTLVPPPPPPHDPKLVDAVAGDEDKADANEGRRRPRGKNKNKKQNAGAINSTGPKQEGLENPASEDSTLESLDSPVIIIATPPVTIAATQDQELPTAETDTEGWQVVAGKKRHGGRDERPAQGLAPTAQHMHDPKKQPPRWSWTAGPSRPTPQHHAPAYPASARSKPILPRIAARQPRWTPSRQTPQRHDRRSPPCPAAASAPSNSNSTPPRITSQHGKREEDDDDLGIERMDEEEDSEREEETDDEEYNGREEDDEMHLSYWIKNKEIKSKDKSKTLCLICYLERRDPVAEIANKEIEIERHLRKVHKMQKRKGYRCQSKGCWVRARNRRDIGRHRFLCHNL
ncbi:hypothetical protein ACQJBY_010854 [Aegilops geniculata]